MGRCETRYIGIRYVSVTGYAECRRRAYRTGTRIATDFAPCTPSTDNSPSRFVNPYKFTGFVVEEGR